VGDGDKVRAERGEKLGKMKGEKKWKGEFVSCLLVLLILALHGTGVGLVNERSLV